MKSITSSFRRPAIQLGLLLAMVVPPVGLPEARAENPFKFIGAKAKQGFAKVARVVSPRRVGTAVHQVKNTAVRGKDKVKAQLIDAPVAYFRDDEGNSNRTETYQTTTYVYPDSSSATTSRTVSFSSDRSNMTHGSSYNVEYENPVPQTDYYTSARYLAAPSRPTTGFRPDINQNPGVPRVYPSPVSVKSRLQAENRTESSALVSNASVLDNQAATTTPATKSVKEITPTPTPPPVSREDLPFGLLMPGKEGMVYSPYREKQIVDVSGIPTGTKVKCPYTGKTFRVP